MRTEVEQGDELMRVPKAVVIFSLVSAAMGVASQPVFPPPALKAARDLQSGLAALNAGRPELSGYLLLDVPDVSAAGRVQGRASSELPGTTSLIVFRSYPTVVEEAKRPGGVRKRLPPRVTGSAPAATAPPDAALPTILVAATRLKPSERAVLDFDFEIKRRETLTFLAFAQGRWFVTTREVKVATDATEAR